MADHGEHKPLTSADLAAMRGEDMARRAGRKVHQKGPLPIHGHVTLEQADVERRKRARESRQYRHVGSDPSGMPDVDEMHGQRPPRPDRSTR